MHPTREDAADEPTDATEQYLPAMPPKALIRAAERIVSRIAKHERIG